MLADEVYQLLYYYEPPATRLWDAGIERQSRVTRFVLEDPCAGYAAGLDPNSEELRKRVEAGGYINSGGSVNHISSLIVRQAIDNGSLDSHSEKLQATYRRRLEAMDDALHQHFDGLATWIRPEGGYFFWVRFDESVDTTPLRKKARELETGFQHGALFSTSGQLKNCCGFVSRITTKTTSARELPG